MRRLAMIDNPVPDIVMAEKDAQYISEQFHEHCRDTAINEIAKPGNLDPGFYDDFIEWYVDLCSESDDGYSLVINPKELIDDWWEENSDMYDDPSPYLDYEPTDQEMLSSFGTKWHDKL